MRRFILGIAMLALAAAPAAADELLLFRSGMTLVVHSWQIEDGWLHLHFRDGGSVVVSGHLLFEAKDVGGPVSRTTWKAPVEAATDSTAVAAAEAVVDEAAARPAPRPASTSIRPAPRRTVRADM